MNMSFEPNAREDFEDKLRKKFDDWEAPAPAWADFQKNIPKKMHKKRFLWGWLSALLAVTFITPFIIFSYAPKNTKINQIVNKPTQQTPPTRTGKKSQTPATAIETSEQQTVENNVSTAPAGKEKDDKIAALFPIAGKDEDKTLPTAPAGKENQ